MARSTNCELTISINCLLEIHRTLVVARIVSLYVFYVFLCLKVPHMHYAWFNLSQNVQKTFTSHTIWLVFQQPTYQYCCTHNIIRCYLKPQGSCSSHIRRHQDRLFNLSYSCSEHVLICYEKRLYFDLIIVMWCDKPLTTLHIPSDWMQCSLHSSVLLQFDKR